MAQIIGSLSGVNNVNGALSQSRQLNGGLSAGGNGSGLTDEIRAALLDCFENVAWINDDGQDYYDALYEALYAIQSIRISPNSALITTIGGTTQLTAITVPSGATVTWSSSDSAVATVSSSGLVTSVALGSCTITATAGSKTATCAVTVAQKTLNSITAVYTQSGTVYTTDSLDSLKSDLVVTAHWNDNTTSTVSSTDYTLSGTLTAGTSVVTVSYGGKTTTFNVTVTAAPTLSSISAVYTQSGTVYDTDSLDSLKADLVVTATYSDTSTATVPSTDYTLSGTLTAGTSTITVTYQSKTTTFNVTVTALLWLFKDGDECTTLTGGYSNSTGFFTNESRVTYSNDGSKMSFVLNTKAWTATAVSLSSANKVDFTDYTTMVIEYTNVKETSAGNGNIWIYISETIANGSSQAAAYGNDHADNRVNVFNYVETPDHNAPTIKEVDISSFTGERYISINYNVWSELAANSYGTVSKIYLK